MHQLITGVTQILIFSTDEWFSLLREECFPHANAEGKETSEGVIHLVTNPYWKVLTSWNSLTNFYSLHYAPVTNQTSSSAHSLAKLAVADKVALVTVDYLLRESQFFENLMGDLQGHAYTVDVEDRYSNWILPLGEETFDEYLASRSSRLKNTIKRAEKKLAKMGSLTFEVVNTNANGLSEIIEDYHDVYNKSWKAQEQSERFISRLIELCAARGELCLGFLKLDGRTLATQFWIVSDRTAFIYKLAYDPEYARLSVGSVLTKRLIEHVFDHVDLVDYGIGDEAYKKEWMTERRQYVRVWAANRTTMGGRLISSIWRLRSFLKRMMN